MKLVRDRIPAIMWAQLHKPKFFVADENLRFSYALTKLREETDELLRANNKSEQAEELADIMEVLLAMADALGIHPDDLERRRVQKKISNGAFRDWIVME